MSVPWILNSRQMRLMIDTADLYEPTYAVSDTDTGRMKGAKYVLKFSGVPCYRWTKKENKNIEPQGQTLQQNLFTIETFQFPIGVPATSNYFLQFLSILKNGQHHPDYGMWFDAQGIPQPLTYLRSNTLEILFKRSLTAPHIRAVA